MIESSSDLSNRKQSTVDLFWKVKYINVHRLVNDA